MQHEIRQDKVTRQWVIYAPSRGKRPGDFQNEDTKPVATPAYDAECPFCAGNDHMLASIVLEIPSRTASTPVHWSTRVVPNKYPALTPDGDTKRFTHGIYLSMAGYGRHEVIIDTPCHNRDIAVMSQEEVETIIETYHRRYTDLMQTHQNMMVVIFRNHGPRAGTSLLHPHSQLIVTGVVPNYIRRTEEEAQRYFDEWGRSMYEDIANFEVRENRRVIAETEQFVAFVPFAADVPFEIWIMPTNHQPDFGLISDDAKTELASILRNVLYRLDYKLNDPDYNYIINTPARYRADEPYARWYLQIRPRLTTPAGFEIGSGISINPSLPEEDADFLNQR